LIGIFLIPLFSLTYLYLQSSSLTQTIEYNLCPIYLLPFFVLTNVIAFLLQKYCTFSLW
jgi:hypothetical protein